jgi:hypothetical protein
MARPKLATPTVVYIVQRVVPYEGMDVLSVHTSVETAQAAHPDKWEHRPATEWMNEYWIAQGRNDLAPFLIIAAFDLKP